jgi:hypothetical protein
MGRASADLALAPGSTEAAHLRDCHAVDADLAKTILDLVELERLDDGFDVLHVLIIPRTCYIASISW